ncbi:MAG: EamA family transporter [Spirochaetales bacterium]|nr:EamA family transporter [Spirochaetales bacterium]
MTITDWILLLILSLLWGGSFFFVEVALTGLPVFTIVFLRVFLGALILRGFLLISGKKLPRDRVIWRRLFIMGLLNNAVPFCLIVTGQQFINGGFASIINGTTPFFTVLAAHFFTRDEKINTRKIAGVILGITGVVVLIGFESLQKGSHKLWGALAVVGAALSYSLAGVWGKGFKKLGLDPALTATGQLLCSSLLLFPVMLLVDKPWQLNLPGLDVWAALLGIALFSTALAYIIYFKILSSSGATNVLLVTFLVPVSAVLLGVLFLSEEFKLQYLYGMLAIGMGLVFIDGRIPAKIRKKFRG